MNFSSAILIKINNTPFKKTTTKKRIHLNNSNKNQEMENRFKIYITGSIYKWLPACLLFYTKFPNSYQKF